MSGSEELTLFNQLVHTAKTMETTKGVVERGAILMPYNQFPVVDGIGLIDGSVKGIVWGH
jgi:hypothetical protein